MTTATQEHPTIRFTKTDSIPPIDEKRVRDDIEFYQRIMPPIPITEEDLTRPPMPCESSTDVALLRAFHQVAQQDFRVKACALANLIGTLKLFSRYDYSRPVIVLHGTLCSFDPSSEEKIEYPAADFYKPSTFDWDEDEFDVSEAVRKYCDSAYADH